MLGLAQKGSLADLTTRADKWASSGSASDHRVPRHHQLRHISAIVADAPGAEDEGRGVRPLSVAGAGHRPRRQVELDACFGGRISSPCIRRSPTGRARSSQRAIRTMRRCAHHQLCEGGLIDERALFDALQAKVPGRVDVYSGAGHRQHPVHVRHVITRRISARRREAGESSPYDRRTDLSFLSAAPSSRAANFPSISAEERPKLMPFLKRRAAWLLPARPSRPGSNPCVSNMPARWRT
jgi:D-3-phosphoglycerate dehydrogenase